jgi:hypothetical protein
MPAIHEMTAITCSALIHSYIVKPYPFAIAPSHHSRHRNIPADLSVANAISLSVSQSCPERRSIRKRHFSK